MNKRLLSILGFAVAITTIAIAWTRPGDSVPASGWVFAVPGCSFMLPEQWSERFRLHRDNIQVGKQVDRLPIGQATIDRDYDRLMKAVLPDARCIAHLGEEPWGDRGVSYADMQLRVLEYQEPFRDAVPKDRWRSEECHRGRWHGFRCTNDGTHGGDLLVSISVEFLSRDKRSEVLTIMYCTDRLPGDDLKLILESYSREARSPNHAKL